jgi:transcriptional regulator with XRE-family HTH domain
MLTTMGRKPKPRKSRLAKQLTDLRDLHGLTQQQAADRVEVSIRTWLSWERGERRPSKHTLAFISSAIGPID